VEVAAVVAVLMVAVAIVALFEHRQKSVFCRCLRLIGRATQTSDCNTIARFSAKKVLATNRCRSDVNNKKNKDTGVERIS
jgi:hypothetical protein